MTFNTNHQTIEEILKTATPAQKLIWNHIFLNFGEACAVRQIFYQGALAGNEINTYVARKFYFIYECQVNAYTAPLASPGAALIYDWNNVLSLQCMNISGLFNATAAEERAYTNTLYIYNFLCGRIVFNAVPNLKYVGFRITY